MKKDLINSHLDRQNILNNDYAISEIEKATQIKGTHLNGKTVVFKEQVAEFFNVTERTIDNYIERYNEELSLNGYVVLRGKALKEFKELFFADDVNENHFVNIKKAPQLGIFDFRAFLNIAMLLSESESARMLRQVILDIVIDVISTKTGGQTKYINQRESTFLTTFYSSENYRQEFTDALRDCVDMGNFKYANYTNKIYISIFRENAEEYKQILKLEKKDNLRKTFYKDILRLISSVEFGFANILRGAFEQEGRKLSKLEVDDLFDNFINQPLWVPLINDARNVMASRDLTLRDAFHIKLKEYISPLDNNDFERFLGKESKTLEEQVKEAKDVLIRMKDK